MDHLVDDTDQTLEDLAKKAGVELDELDLSKNVDEVTDNVDITKKNPVSLAERMSVEDKEKYKRFLKYGSTQGFTDAEIYTLSKVDEAIALNKVDYDEVLELKKAANKVEDSINTDELLGDSKSVNKISEGGTKAKSTLDHPKLEKHVRNSFEGTGKEVQDNFNKYLRENVWCDETLSNAEKIDIMKANFDKLTPQQKINFNVSNEVKVLKNPDYSNWGEWPDFDWPDFPGLNKDTAKSVYNEVTGNIEISRELDRLGSPYGNNLGVVEDGYHCTQNERSICYIENGYARNSYKFDETYYKDAIDAIKDFDIDNTEESVNKINSIIDQLNTKNGTSNAHITENNVADWYSQYKAFQSKSGLIELCKEKGLDSTYGVMGEASSWIVNRELITSGGAGQINIPINVKALEDMGILQNVGGWQYETK